MKKCFSRILLTLGALLVPSVALAQITTTTWLDFLFKRGPPPDLSPDATIGEILTRLYVYGVGLVVLSAFIMFVIGGVRYMVAGDRDPSEAKAWMKNAFWGLVIALTSWLILYTINPDLVAVLKLEPLKIELAPEYKPPSQQEQFTDEEILRGQIRKSAHTFAENNCRYTNQNQKIECVNKALSLFSEAEDIIVACAKLNSSETAQQKCRAEKGVSTEQILAALEKYKREIVSKIR